MQDAAQNWCGRLERQFALLEMYPKKYGANPVVTSSEAVHISYDFSIIVRSQLNTWRQVIAVKNRPNLPQYVLNVLEGCRGTI